MKKPKIPFLFNRLGVSYAISAVIMTATTITLVIVASTYAYQILEQQRGTSEFGIAKKAILAFDDALENTAWKPQSSRSTRFTVKYGKLELVPNALLLNVTAQVGGNSSSYDVMTGLIRYSTKTDYVSFGNNYEEYILGDNRTIVPRGTESFGQAVIKQQSKWVNITLSYRVCAMKTSVTQVGGQDVTYVDIWIIKVNILNWSNHIGDFDLKAKCISVTTPLSALFNVTEPGIANISAKLGNESSDPLQISLVQGVAVFNFVVADVKVSV